MTTPDTSQKELSPKQIKFLRGLGHKINPLVLIGKEGLSSSVLIAIESELKNHELVKVKIGNNSDLEKKVAASLIPEQTQSHLVQLIGKTLLLYKENQKRSKEKKIKIPNI